MRGARTRGKRGAGDRRGAGHGQWEIPYSAVEEKPPDDTVVEVRLMRKGNERLGLVLDASNVVVALRPETPASLSCEIFTGDQILAVQGIECTAEKRVAQLLRELPDAAVYAFTVKRALGHGHAGGGSVGGGPGGSLSTEVAEHGPLLTPEEAKEYEQRELERRQQLRDYIASSSEIGADEKQALQQQLAPRNLTESKYASAKTEMSKEATDQMKAMWYRQARSDLARRLSAAEMLKDEGNDKFAAGEYRDALEEYEYALDLFKYEMANLLRDQEAAELGDLGRGLGSDDLPAIQRVRVPCLLNSSACYIKLGGKKELTRALECCAEVLQAGPPAPQRAKAHFRVGQAHCALENFRESWVALTQAQELNPGSREVRNLQAKVSYELKQLKVRPLRARAPNPHRTRPRPTLGHDPNLPPSPQHSRSRATEP